jgi:AraC-like DNA-binding protein
MRVRKQPPRAEPFDRAATLARIAAAQVLALFEHLPHVYLFVKDARHRFVQVNAALWRLHGCADAGGMIGRTDFDFHPPTLAGQYVDEDRGVMARGVALVDRPWLVPGADGLPLWYLSSKHPLRDARGGVFGICGVLRPCGEANAVPDQYRRLAPALTAVLQRFGEPLTVVELARCARLSVSQLQREFARLLHMTPSGYLLRVRMLMARRLLEQGAAAIGSIALDTGFYDQSHFTRTFRAATGLRPLEYRRRFGVEGRAGAR